MRTRNQPGAAPVNAGPGEVPPRETSPQDIREAAFPRERETATDGKERFLTVLLRALSAWNT